MPFFRPYLVFLLFVLGLVLAPVKFALADAEEAADMYRQAQELKRDHQFEDARIMFDTVANMDDTGVWGDLAADELRYGLPMFEADYWMVKFGRASQDPSKQDTQSVNYGGSLRIKRTD